MGEPPSEKPRFQTLKAVRYVIFLPILINVNLVALALYVATTALHLKCPKGVVADVFFLASVSCIRVIWLIINGYIQAKTARAMIAENPDPVSNKVKSDGKSIESDRQRWYGLWLWWNRFGTLVLILQVVAACLMFQNKDHIQYGSDEKRLQTLLMILPFASFQVVILGWFTGSDVMSWRSLYKSNDAWRSHYSEAFRCCIREALCCMGRYRYLAPAQKDEVYTVASLLGDLVTYRAEGCSHLEVLAGVSMLRGYEQRLDQSGKQEPAPDNLLREASILHPYAVAAYTGPLLEMGRYPYCWLFVWLYSQGFWSFWQRSRRPVLEGDNLWRGHASAFIRHARLPHGALLKGRVLQTRRESAYFVVVLHGLRTVVVAVRGTETPEDLLTDGLSKETPLSESDLSGLLKGPQVSKEVKQLVKERDHYAHSGIIEAARELSMQLDNLAEDDDDAMAPSIGGRKGDALPNGCARQGLLSKLLGPDGECKGYHLRIVGHSLGGAISALIGLRLYRRYPKLHVYAFGVLPCVDVNIAEACQGFITSVVFHDEFSSRLSVASITRLRANALKALSQNSKLERDLEGQRSWTGNSSTPCSHFFGSSPSDSHSSSSSDSHGSPSDSNGTVDTTYRTNFPSSLGRKKWSELKKTQRLPYMFKGGAFLCAHTCFCVFKMSQHHKAIPLSSEVERLSKRQSTADEDHERASLIPPVPVLTNNVGVAMEIQSHERDCREVFAAGSSGHDFLSRKDSELLPNGMPTKMGSGFSRIADEQADAQLQELYPDEMFLPGQVLHIVREEEPAKSWRSSFWNAWRAERESNYRALVVDRKKFRDIVISPSMFIDHMPWKCQHALNSILNQLNKSQSSTLDKV